MDSPLCPLALAPLLLACPLALLIPRAGKVALSLSFSFTIPLWRSLRANMMYSSGICQCGKRGEEAVDRPTSAVRRGMSLAGDGCASCQRLLPTCDADGGRDAPARSPYTFARPPLHYISNYNDHHCGGGICCSGIIGVDGAVSEGRTRFGSTVHDI